MTDAELNKALKMAWLLKKKYPDEKSGYLIEALALEVRRLERERDELSIKLTEAVGFRVNAEHERDEI